METSLEWADLQGMRLSKSLERHSPRCFCEDILTSLRLNHSRNRLPHQIIPRCAFVIAQIKLRVIMIFYEWSLFKIFIKDLSKWYKSEIRLSLNNCQLFKDGFLNIDELVKAFFGLSEVLSIICHYDIVFVFQFLFVWHSILAFD